MTSDEKLKRLLLERVEFRLLNGKYYGVAQITISNIITRKHWRHI